MASPTATAPKPTAKLARPPQMMRDRTSRPSASPPRMCPAARALAGDLGEGLGGIGDRQHRCQDRQQQDIPRAR